MFLPFIPCYQKSHTLICIRLHLLISKIPGVCRKGGKIPHHIPNLVMTDGGARNMAYIYLTGNRFIICCFRFSPRNTLFSEAVELWPVDYVAKHSQHASTFVNEKMIKFFVSRVDTECQNDFSRSDPCIIKCSTHNFMLRHQLIGDCFASASDSLKTIAVCCSSDQQPEKTDLTYFISSM